MEDRILILAPTGKDAALTAEALAAERIASHICPSIRHLMIEVPHGAGAVLVVEEALRDGGYAPLAEHVAQQPNWSDLPILLLTQNGADSPHLQQMAFQLGNVTMLERPIRAVTLISAVRSALRARRRQYRVREAEQRKDEFLASLGHELRNPLAPIRTAMSVLKSRYGDHMPVVQIADLVERQIVHLTRLVDDLLDVARITNGKVQLQRRTIRLSEVVAHAIELCSALLKQSGHRLAIEQPQDEVYLYADHARVVQSVANVLINAIKFTPQPGLIELTVTVEGGNVVFRVRDTGIGLEKEALTRIFDMFAQNHPAPGQLHGGLGIGLSLARQFTQMHGGTINASSEGLGKGSQFEIRLPVVCEAPPDSTTAPEPVGGGLELLIVDDNRDAADMLAALLEVEGYAVRTAYDGLQALSALDKRPADVVLMDLGMPGLDGYDTASRIRQSGGGDMVLIALTGWGQEEARHRTRAAGFDHHLVKPIEIDLLMSCLEEVAAKAKVRAES